MLGRPNDSESVPFLYFPSQLGSLFSWRALFFGCALGPFFLFFQYFQATSVVAPPLFLFVRIFPNI